LKKKEGGGTASAAENTNSVASNWEVGFEEKFGLMHRELFPEARWHRYKGEKKKKEASSLSWEKKRSVRTG